MKLKIGKLGALIGVAVLRAFARAEVQETLDQTALRQFGENLTGTLHCRSADYPIEYTLVGNPGNRTVTFSASGLSKVIVKGRELSVRVLDGGLTLQLSSPELNSEAYIKVSADPHQVELWRSTVGHGYVYAGSITGAAGDDTESVQFGFFTAFHGGCRFVQ